MFHADEGFPPEEEEELMDLEDRLDMLLEQADEMQNL